MQDEILGIITHVFPVSLVEDHLGVAAFVDEVLEVLRPERRVTAEKGVCDDTHGPHIDGLAMTLLQHDFGGGVAEGASHCREDFVLAVEHLSNAEIGKNEIGLNVPGQVKQVLRFQVCILC